MASTPLNVVGVGRIGAAVVLLIVLASTMADSAAAERFVIANGSELAIYEAKGAHLARVEPLLDTATWVGVRWPGWDPERRNVIFEGKLAASADAVAVYAFPLSPNGRPGEVRRIASGRLPAVSTDGRFVALVDAQGRLRVASALDGSVLLEEGPTVGSSRPVVWVGDDSIAFLDADRELRLLNVASRAIRSVGVKDVIPAAAISGSNRLICVDYEGRKLSIVDVVSGSASEIRSYFGTSLGPTVIWDARNESFLIARQTWWNLLRLSQARNVFRMTLDGSERQVAEELTLIGGFPLD